MKRKFYPITFLLLILVCLTNCDLSENPLVENETKLDVSTIIIPKGLSADEINVIKNPALSNDNNDAGNYSIKMDFVENMIQNGINYQKKSHTMDNGIEVIDEIFINNVSGINRAYTTVNVQKSRTHIDTATGDYICWSSLFSVYSYNGSEVVLVENRLLSAVYSQYSGQAWITSSYKTNWGNSSIRYTYGRINWGTSSWGSFEDTFSTYCDKDGDRG